MYRSSLASFNFTPSVLFWNRRLVSRKVARTHPEQHRGKPNIMITTEDFIALCKKGEWEIASVYVNELWEKGEDARAEALRRIFLQCQVDFEPLMEFIPYQHPTPPVLEKCWYDGDKGIDIDQLYSETAENAEAVYQAHRAQVASTV